MKDLNLKDHYRNQNFNIIHEFFWGFGTAFHTVYAVVPLFLKKFFHPGLDFPTSSASYTALLQALATQSLALAPKANISTFSAAIIILSQ